jgi:DNA gyrase/topoisomerase IV subunit B
MEIMSILGIEPGATDKCSYSNIIIACDSDADGQLINI